MIVTTETSSRQQPQKRWPSGTCGTQELWASPGLVINRVMSIVTMVLVVVRALVIVLVRSLGPPSCTFQPIGRQTGSGLLDALGFGGYAHSNALLSRAAWPLLGVALMYQRGRWRGVEILLNSSSLPGTYSPSVFGDAARLRHRFRIALCNLVEP